MTTNVAVDDWCCLKDLTMCWASFNSHIIINIIIPTINFALFLCLSCIQHSLADFFVCCCLFHSSSGLSRVSISILLLAWTSEVPWLFPTHQVHCWCFSALGSCWAWALRNDKIEIIGWMGAGSLDRITATHCLSTRLALWSSHFSSCVEIDTKLSLELFFLVFNLILQDFQPFFQDLKRF